MGFVRRHSVIVSSIISVVVMVAGLTVVNALSDSDLALFVAAFVLGLLIALILGKLYPRRRRAA